MMIALTVEPSEASDFRVRAAKNRFFRRNVQAPAESGFLYGSSAVIRF